MKVSRKSQYALRALIDLALHSAAAGGRRSFEIAQHTGVPEKFLEVILIDLRKAGLVASKRGPHGGHRLARPPESISVGTVLRSIDGHLALVSRAKTEGAGGRFERCLESLWRNVEQAIDTVVNNITLAQLQQAMAGRDTLDFEI